MEVGLKLHSDKTKVFTNSNQKTALPMEVNGRKVEVLLDEACTKYLGRSI